MPLLTGAVTVAGTASADTVKQVCPGIEVSTTFTRPDSETTYTVYVPAHATLHIEGSADIRGRDTTGGWQTILSIDPVVYTLLGDYYGGPYSDRGFAGNWAQGDTGGDVTLHAHQQYGTDVQFRFKATITGGNGGTACGDASAPTTPPVPTKPPVITAPPDGPGPTDPKPSATISATPSTPAPTAASSMPSPGATPRAKTFVMAPDIKLVRFLQVPLSDCERAVGKVTSHSSTHVPDGLAAAKITAACGFLVGASNPNPPTRVDDDRWRRFVASKEYRGFVHLAPYQLYCTGGRATAVVPQKLTSSISPGFTPLPTGHSKTRIVYEKAEYLADDLYRSQTEEVRYTPGRDGAVVSLRVAARIAAVARRGQHALLGYDAPFIWSTLHVRLGCDGSYQVVTSWSTIPRLAVYIDDRLTTKTQQTGDLASFITSGGTKLHRAGQGELFPDCGTATVATRGAVARPVSPTIDCRIARDNAGLDVPSNGSR